MNFASVGDCWQHYLNSVSHMHLSTIVDMALQIYIDSITQVAFGDGCCMHSRFQVEVTFFLLEVHSCLCINMKQFLNISKYMTLD